MKITLKTTVAIALCALSVLSVTACSTSEVEDSIVPDGMVMASPENAEYYLFVPEDWVVDTEDSSLMASAHVSDADYSNITMMYYTNNTYDTIEAYWEYYKTSLCKVFDTNEDGEPIFEMITENESAIVDEQAAMKYVYTATLGGVELKYLQVIVSKDNQYYIFTYTAYENFYDESIDDVNAIIGNIIFK